RLKGPGRPVNSLEDRAQVLAALSCVDYIVPFEQDTPVELIQAIRPDVVAKGGNYSRQTLPEAALVESLGGSVHILPYLEDHTTADILKRIRETPTHPAFRVDDGGSERAHDVAEPLPVPDDFVYDDKWIGATGQ